MIKNYYQYINEGKQRGALYHVLNVDSLKYVIENDAITGHHYSNTISTTRNKMLNSYTGSRAGGFFKLELDGDKLSDTYKIKPFLYRSSTNVNLEEFEEQIKTREIKPASKYINKIIIIKDSMENARKGWMHDREDDDYKRPTYWFSTDAKGHNRMQFFIKWLKENSESPIYIQEGSKIYKDDDYVDSLINEPVHKVNYGSALYYRGRTEIVNDDIYSQKDALFPLDERNSIIENPVIGELEENLHLISKEEAIEKMSEIEDKGEMKIYKNRQYPNGDKYREKLQLYYVTYELLHQEEMSKDGFIKKARIDDYKPASWVLSYIKNPA